jgi:RNA polymerase sigma-70 factor (ECF subfamily)
MKDFEYRLIEEITPAIKYCRRWIKDEEFVKDIIQDVILTAWEKRDSFQENGNLTAWLMQIAKFKLYTFNRDENNKVNTYQWPFTYQPNLYDEKLIKKSIERAIKKLPDSKREIMQGLWDGVPITVVKAKTGTTPKSFKSNLYGIRVRMAKALGIEFAGKQDKMIPPGMFGKLKGEKAMIIAGVKYVKYYIGRFHYTKKIPYLEIGIKSTWQRFGVGQNFAEAINVHLFNVEKRVYSLRARLTKEDVSEIYHEFKKSETQYRLNWIKELDDEHKKIFIEQKRIHKKKYLPRKYELERYNKRKLVGLVPGSPVPTISGTGDPLLQ